VKLPFISFQVKPGMIIGVLKGDFSKVSIRCGEAVHSEVLK
jgi:hypothetical protein